jgi:hypothetical protein
MSNPIFILRVGKKSKICPSFLKFKQKSENCGKSEMTGDNQKI